MKQHRDKLQIQIGTLEDRLKNKQNEVAKCKEVPKFHLNTMLFHTCTLNRNLKTCIDENAIPNRNVWLFKLRSISTQENKHASDRTGSEQN